MTASFQRLELLSQQIHQAHRCAIDAEMTRRGLCEVNPLILAILQHVEESEQRSFSQRDLARMLHISPPAVTNSLKAMEKNGYIAREPEESDARRNRILLTEKGRAAVKECEAVFLAVSERMLAGFTPEEQELLTDFRIRMVNNLRGDAPAQRGDCKCFNCL